MPQNQAALAPIIRCILKPHHDLLRKEMTRAADLTGSVVVEQRPPLCRTLLPLFRLFQEFRCDLEEHLDALQTRLFPRLLDLEAALRSGEQPVSSVDDVSEGLRMLKYRQITLASILDEMRELTHGFVAPHDACECYGELLDVLAAIQMEVASELRMEGSMLLPPAAQLLDEARRGAGGAGGARGHAGRTHAMHVM